MAAPDTIGALARLEHARVAHQQARRDAVHACESAVGRADGEERRSLIRILRRVRGGQLAEASGALGDVLAELARVVADEAAAHTDLERTFASERIRLTAALREHAGDPKFREAVLWQNRHALVTGLDPFVRRIDEGDEATVKQERLVANYLQRYCVKNDTIGFFGPVGWGSFATAGPTVTARPGPTLIGKRTLYFEHWCIDALASRLAEDDILRPHLAPRIVPTIWLAGATVHAPTGETTELPDEFARLLAACDGERSALEIAEALAAEDSLEITIDDALAMLEELAQKRFLFWTLEIPTTDLHPEATLRRLLERAGDAGAAGRAALDELEAARAEVARAAGDEPRLAHAFTTFNETFTRLTGQTGLRRAGKVYSGRTIVHEECRRDLEIEFGPELLARLGPPLALVLDSARWYSYEVASRYRKLCTDAFEKLREQTGSATIEYLRFWAELEPLFAPDQSTRSTIVADVLAELQARWVKLIDIAPGTREITRSVADLAADAARAFAAPHPGWPMAIYHSPDLMIRARDAEAMRRGEFTVVMGEVHTGSNTLCTAFVLDQHPSPADLLRARRADLARPSLGIVDPKEHATRASHQSVLPDDFALEVGPTRSWRGRTYVIPAASLVVESIGGELVVRTRDGARRFDILEVVESYLLLATTSVFSLFPPLPYMPRIIVDGLVIARERWRFAPSDLAFAALATPLERFRAAREWATTRGLPRLVFYKIPEEPKPCYLDFDSPIYVDIFCKLLRKASSVNVSEMLPTIDECWLPDAEGNHYTCELRMAAVDPLSWTPRS